MKIYGLRDKWFLVLSFITILSFVLGFAWNENSAGAGGLTGDFQNTWKNLNTFKKNDLATALDYVESGNRDYYVSSRTPVLYIFNSILNPFTYSINSFINSIFIFSLFGFFLFYKSLTESFPKNSKAYLLLLSCTLLLSPYFRTSAFWGAEENYGIISTILTFLFFNRLNFRKINKEFYIYLYLTIFFSSLTVYFDQKLIIIPIVILLDIFLLKKINLKIKIFTIINYFILSIPFIYFILSWHSIVPVGDSINRGVGKKILFYHPMYLTTIISFYLLPLLLFKKKISIKDNIMNSQTNLTIILLFTFYLISIFYFNNLDIDSIYGKGAVFKIISLIFKNDIFKQISIILLSFISFLIILIFCNKKIYYYFFFFFLLFSSIFIYPIFQEYYDPLILIIVLLYFFKKEEINFDKKNILILFFYLVFFLASAKIYYHSILVI